ncbi:MAG: hypothetical protein KJ067_22820 [Vicinamibacteria bacterium]|nr:hypothetical protein [Vicinamibacteria bacterium]
MRRFLWFDAFAGTSVGLLLFAFADWLAPLFGYSLPFARGLAAANFGYGCFALVIASRFPASAAAIPWLIAANAAWPLVSLALVAWVRDSATSLGLAYLGAEAVFVGVLAGFEARALARLRSAAPAA